MSLLGRCLRKDPRQRQRDMGDVRLLLTEEVLGQPSGKPDDGRGKRPAVLIAALALLVGAAIGGIASRMVAPERDDPRQPLSRFAVEPPSEGVGPSFSAGRIFDLSPDGSELVLVGESGGFHRRRFDRLGWERVSGVGFFPRYSGDQRWIAFWSGGFISRVAAGGGEPEVLLSASDGGQALWGRDGSLFVGSASLGLLRLAPGGEEPTTILPAGDDARRPIDLTADGRGLLLSTELVGGREPVVEILDLESGELAEIGPGMAVGFAPTGPLLFARGSSLWGQRFDHRALRALGEAVELERAEETDPPGWQWVLSPEGTLAYLIGDRQFTERQLVWRTRDGTESPSGLQPRAYGHFRLSPDGRRIAVNVRDPDLDIETCDLVTGTCQGLTTHPTQDYHPRWEPGGSRIVFSSSRDGTGFRLFAKSSDGTGEAEQLTHSAFAQLSGSIVGGQIVFAGPTEESVDYDISILDLETGSVRPLLEEDWYEGNAQISPDGRFLAYRSDESGEHAIYVRRFPSLEDKERVSPAGGQDPRWNPDGSGELFYVEGGERLQSVMIVENEWPRVERPTTLFSHPFVINFGDYSWDVAPGGERFLVLGSSSEPRKPQRIVVVQNFLQEIERLLPAE